MQGCFVAGAAFALFVAASPVRAEADPKTSKTAKAPKASSDDAGEAVETISLSKLVKLAVQQSPTLALARSNRQLADLNETIAGAPDEWQLTASVDVTKKAEDPIANSIGQVIGATDLKTRLGLGKRMFTGGDVTVALSNSQQAIRYGEAPNATARASVSIASMSVRQPLLRGIGGGARINEQKAALVADAATLSAMDQGASTLRDLVTSYWGVALARANLDVRIQSEKLAKEQFDLTTKMHARGTVPDAALKAAAYGLALREETTMRAQRDLENASVSLRQLAGLELGPEQIELNPTDPITTDRRAWDLDDLLATALARNPRIAAAKLGIDLADVDLKVRSNGLLPSLDVNLSAGAVGVGRDFGASASALGSRSSYQVSAGLSFGWEIGGSARALEEAARIQRTTAKRTARDTEREVVAVVVLAVHELRAAQKRVEVASRAIDLAEANLATELALFRADKSSNVLVFERQTELDEARLLQVGAAIAYRVAVAAVEYFTGSILKHYGVEVVPPRA